MRTLYDVTKLVKHVQSKLDSKLTINEIEELLRVSEDAYHKDSPRSVGKRLIVQNIAFKGLKYTEESPQPFHYQRKLQSGVNLWVGDNFVGKSSILKIIKFALTGDDAIAKDVSNWLTEIWVDFEVGSNSYLAHIYRNENKKFHFEFLKGQRETTAYVPAEDKQLELFDSSTIDLLTTPEPFTYDDKILFQGGMGKYQEFIKNFFFQEFSYYSLQWTQKSGRADSIDLNTSNASWSTYYKSVFLEAEDYGILFIGSQAELIFQMLLGLELTYPINRIGIKRKQLLNEIAQLESAKKVVNQQAQNDNTNKHKEIETELTTITKRLIYLEEKARIASAPQPQSNIEQRLEQARENYVRAVARRGDLETEGETLERTITSLERKIASLNRQIEDYDIDIKKKVRHIGDLQDSIDLGTFFNSLEVHTCPNCNHAVEKQKVVHEKSTGSCRLCDNEVEQQVIDEVSFKNQINLLKKQRQILFDQQYNVKVDLASTKNDLEKNKKRIEAISIEITSLNINHLFSQLETFKENLVKDQPPSYDWTAHVAEVAKLSAQGAILRQNLSQQTITLLTENSELERKELHIKAIEIAEEKLQEERNNRSRSLIETFEELYLKQLRAFGLNNYKRVEVKNNFKINYFINDGEYSFHEISVGEKLRAKLGLYIALIELDVEHQLGRHPRLLILDSPAREEGDKAYVKGLSTTLAYIQEHFGHSLQILVGTAQRDLSDSVSSDRVEIRADDEYFF